MDEGSLRGRLVVATPALRDPNFAHAVVLVLDHSDEGAVGLVLNRPSEVELSSALPDWHALAADPAVVFIGGPVQREAVIALARTDGDSAAVQPILPGTGVVDLAADATLKAAEIRAVRVFAGYAGWGAGQLEQEVDAGGWFTVDTRPDDPFADEPDRLWGVVLRRQGGVLKTIPENPSLN